MFNTVSLFTLNGTNGFRVEILLFFLNKEPGKLNAHTRQRFNHMQTCELQFINRNINTNMSKQLIRTNYFRLVRVSYNNFLHTLRGKRNKKINHNKAR